MSTRKSPPSVLFICTGNICRSPTAHALLLHKAAEQDFEVFADSAAISSAMVGNLPDRRALAELQRRGVSMPVHHARLVTEDDFTRFDHIIGMTAEHVRRLQELAPSRASKMEMLMWFAEGEPLVDVPDPWYGSKQDFVVAFDMIEAGVDGLLQQMKRQR